MKISEIKGVNLGGWLVLERWIASDVFRDTDANDEYSLCLELGSEQAVKRLAQHRGSFITEQTIARIADSGLNTVRLPVGYWLFGDAEPFVDGASRHVDQLFSWAQKYSIRVILDIHAVPGSQNGWDHSGRAGEISWHKDPSNIEATLDFLAHLCERYGNHTSLEAIEVLNEPHWDIPLSVLVDYYHRAYQIVRGTCSGKVAVIFSDSFRAGKVSRVLSDSAMENITLDMHLYQLFTDQDRELDLEGHLHKACRQWPKTIREASSRLPVLVGEWSAAMDESRVDYTNDDYCRYFKTQIEMFESQHVGWVYWTVRTQDGGAWSLLDHPEFIAS